ncbi:hypothetical protein BN126_2008 [Cronobacter sakazakii 680]|nr:hypothetical protein BN126_2008 [Cronobacter sakazakii 680]
MAGAGGKIYRLRLMPALPRLAQDDLPLLPFVLNSHMDISC